MLKGYTIKNTNQSHKALEFSQKAAVLDFGSHKSCSYNNSITNNQNCEFISHNWIGLIVRIIMILLEEYHIYISKFEQQPNKYKLLLHEVFNIVYINAAYVYLIWCKIDLCKLLAIIKLQPSFGFMVCFFFLLQAL